MAHRIIQIHVGLGMLLLLGVHAAIAADRGAVKRGAAAKRTMAPRHARTGTTSRQRLPLPIIEPDWNKVRKNWDKVKHRLPAQQRTIDWKKARVEYKAAVTQMRKEIDKTLKARVSAFEQERKTRQARAARDLKRTAPRVLSLTKKFDARRGTAPHIYNVEPESGEPGDSILLTGNGWLTASDTKVYFTLPGDNGTYGATSCALGGKKIEAEYAEVLNRKQRVVRLPEQIEGIKLPHFRGVVYAERPDTTRSRRPFKLKPRIVIESIFANLDLCDICEADSTLAPPVADTTNLERGYVCHAHDGVAALFAGAKGDDRFFKTTQLKNGWLVDDAYIWSLKPSTIILGLLFGDCKVSVKEYRKGTTSPYVRTHWWWDVPVYGVMYEIEITAKGPVGIPPI